MLSVVKSTNQFCVDSQISGCHSSKTPEPIKTQNLTWVIVGYVTLQAKIQTIALLECMGEISYLRGLLFFFFVTRSFASIPRLHRTGFYAV